MPKKERKHVTLYTYGNCPRYIGPGGYGVVLRYSNHRKELSAGFRLTTSDRMELMAAIAALEALKTKCNVTLYTESRLLADGVSKEPVEALRKKVWKNIKRKVSDVDLWKQLAKLIVKHTVQAELIKSNSGDREFERAVELAEQAIQHRCVNIDAGYVKIPTQKELPSGHLGQKPRVIRKKRPIPDQNPEGKGRDNNPKPATTPQKVRCQYCGKEVGLYFNEELGDWVIIAHFGQAPVRRFGFGANMQIHCQGSNRPAR